MPRQPPEISRMELWQSAWFEGSRLNRPPMCQEMGVGYQAASPPELLLKRLSLCPAALSPANGVPDCPLQCLGAEF